MMYFTQAELDYFLSEDVPYHDETSHVLGIEHQPGELIFAAKKDGFVLCGSELVARMAHGLGVQVEVMQASGAWVAAGESFLHVRGAAGALHRLWKVGVTLLETACGVATRTRNMVDAAQAVNPRVQVATTRKAPPGLRKLMFHAVLAGGGVIHRAGLSETLLVFEQHRVFLGAERLPQIFARLKTLSPEKKIMAEAENLHQALEFAHAGADVLQLEKMPLDALKQTVTVLKEEFPKLIVSATGGITLSNAAEHAACGVDLLVTSHPYHAPPADIRASMRAL